MREEAKECDGTESIRAIHMGIRIEYVPVGVCHAA